jgi:hypothetical protein
MKPISVIVLPLALLAGSAFGQPADPSAPDKAVTTESVPPAPAPALQNPNPLPVAPPALQRLMIRNEHPSAADHEDNDAEQRDLEYCGRKWNKKMEAYKDARERTADYQSYFEKWQDFAAQRPPKPMLPELTRASYRLCMAQCLGDQTASCPDIP